MAAGKFKRPSDRKVGNLRSRTTPRPRLLIERSKRVIAFSTDAIYIGSSLFLAETRRRLDSTLLTRAKNPSIRIN